MSKILHLLLADRFCQAKNALKPIFDRGSASKPAGGAYDAPPDPLVGWRGGHPLPIDVSRRLDLAAIPPPFVKEIYANEDIYTAKTLYEQVLYEAHIHNNSK